MPKSKQHIPIEFSWKHNLKNRNFLIEFSITFLSLIIVLIVYSHFLNFAESRQGFQLHDPFLDLFQPINLTWLIFGVVYSGIILFLILLIKNPKKIIFAFQSYILLVLMRITAMYLVQLDPPKNMIPLVDPIVQYFGTDKVLTKDLFFSGHTATLFLFFLIVETKPAKAIFLIFTIAAAVGVLLQHVHYSIDVIFAFFFAYLAYKFIFYIKNALLYTDS